MQGSHTSFSLVAKVHTLQAKQPNNSDFAVTYHLAKVIWCSLEFLRAKIPNTWHGIILKTPRVLVTVNSSNGIMSPYTAASVASPLMRLIWASNPNDQSTRYLVARRVRDGSSGPSGLVCYTWGRFKTHLVRNSIEKGHVTQHMPIVLFKDHHPTKWAILLVLLIQTPNHTTIVHCEVAQPEVMPQLCFE